MKTGFNSRKITTAGSAPARIIKIHPARLHAEGERAAREAFIQQLYLVLGGIFWSFQGRFVTSATEVKPLSVRQQDFTAAPSETRRTDRPRATSS